MGEKKEQSIAKKYANLITYFADGLTPEMVSDENILTTIMHISSRLQKAPKYSGLDIITRGEIARSAVRTYKERQKSGGLKEQ